MKTLIFTKPSQVGEVKVVLRIVKQKLYFKYSHNQYAEQAIKDFASRGVKFRKALGWLEVDLFGDHREANIGEIYFDFVNDSIESIENKLAVFYTSQYVKSGFKLE